MDNIDYSNQLDDRLELMVGKTYKYNGGIIRVRDVRRRGNIAMLITEGAPVYINIDDLDNELKAFKQIDDNMLVRDTRIVDSLLYSDNIYDVIKNTLLDVVKRIDNIEGEYTVQRAQTSINAMDKLIELEKARITALISLK